MTDTSIDPTALLTSGDYERSQSILEEAELEPEPSVEEIPETVLDLIFGISDESGSAHRKAEVRELTGRDEEAMSKVATSKDATGIDFANLILERGVVRIGDFEGQTLKSSIDKLTIPDRDLLIRGVRTATFGKTMRIDQLTCPSCQFTFSVEYDFHRDVPFRKTEEDSPVLSIKLSGGEAVVRLPTIADQKYVERAKTTNVGEKNSVMLSRIVSSIDGREVSLSQIRDLGMADRRTLNRELVERTPGLRYEEVKQDCPKCDFSFPLPVSVYDMFLG